VSERVSGVSEPPRASVQSATKHFFSSTEWTSRIDSITFSAVVGGSN
jgi:hypothetical protein